MIGIMDWGVGGLGVYKTFRAKDDAMDVIYVSDSGYTPYGKTSRDELRTRLAKVAEFYKSHSVHEVIVACNAASSVLDGDAENFAGVTFSGIISAGVRAIAASPFHSVGVIGGGLTIRSQAYQSRLKDFDRRFSFEPAQPLSALVESGQLQGPEVEAPVADVLNRLGNVEAILLACTHYPALAPVFRKLAPSTALLDPAEFVQIPVRKKNSASEPRLRVFTTGEREPMQRAARAAWAFESLAISQVKI